MYTTKEVKLVYLWFVGQLKNSNVVDYPGTVRCYTGGGQEPLLTGDLRLSNLKLPPAGGVVPHGTLLSTVKKGVTFEVGIITNDLLGDVVLKT